MSRLETPAKAGVQSSLAPVTVLCSVNRAGCPLSWAFRSMRWAPYDCLLRKKQMPPPIDSNPSPPAFAGAGSSPLPMGEGTVGHRQRARLALSHGERVAPKAPGEGVRSLDLAAPVPANIRWGTGKSPLGSGAGSIPPPVSCAKAYGCCGRNRRVASHR